MLFAVRAKRSTRKRTWPAANAGMGSSTKRVCFQSHFFSSRTRAVSVMASPSARLEDESGMLLPRRSRGADSRAWLPVPSRARRGPPLYATPREDRVRPDCDCSPGKAGGINVSRSKRLDGDASRPLAPPYGGQKSAELQLILLPILVLLVLDLSPDHLFVSADRRHEAASRPTY